MSETVFDRLWNIIGDDQTGKRVVRMEPPIGTRDVDPVSAMYAYVTYEPALARYALKFFARDGYEGGEYVTHYVPGPYVADNTVFEPAKFG